MNTHAHNELSFPVFLKVMGSNPLGDSGLFALFQRKEKNSKGKNLAYAHKPVLRSRVIYV